jgi:cobalt/nickel transport system permease protein
MHIPDGYLSPATCAAMYAASAPFWYVAVRRLKRLLTNRLIPLLSVFAAFSFVVMMFNLPLPGGTTGHAVGVGIAAIVLGPWASILAISIALLIQALFFGDGGVTALGANCFNMAVAGSLVAYASYRLLAGKAAITSRRRVVAAAVAGYLSINVSALLTAIEFGIQPLFFKDPTGAPLYAPYPLSVAIPAMMIGHLTIAGMAELILTAGLVAWLARSHPSLLHATAPGASGAGASACPAFLHSFGASASEEEPAGWRILRPLLIGLATLLLLTPLGILAVGTAWGEWSPSDFPAPALPQGLGRLATLWTAPFPDYAPPFLRSASFGYMLSAVFGAGLILLAALLADRLFARRKRAP